MHIFPDGQKLKVIILLLKRNYFKIRRKKK